MKDDNRIRLRKRVAPTAVHQDQAQQPATSEIRLERWPLSRLKPATRRTRQHTRAKRELIKASDAQHGEIGAVVATEDGTTLDGHERLEAYRELGRDLIPVLVVPNRSPAAVTAARLILNRAVEVGVTWHMPSLALDLQEVLKFNPILIATTGFTMAEVDGALFKAMAKNPEADLRPEEAVSQRAVIVSRLGDIWKAGGHLLVCGNSREHQTYVRLLGPTRADMVLSDPPFGIKVRNISGRHAEFIEGSGMTEAEARAFFDEFLEAMSGHVKDGAIVDLFIDGRGLLTLAAALKRAGYTQKAICVWDKQAGGMGSLYRHQVGFVIVSKWGRAPHTNNVQLGVNKRNRTTLWSSPGMAQFGSGRAEALDAHPTVKPIGLLSEALLDTSDPGDIILDPFCGTGSTLIACERVGRIGRGIELDPKYVDIAIRRLEHELGEEAVHAETGLTFAETARAREAEDRAPSSRADREAQS